MPGAEAESRVQNHHPLTLARTAAAPAGLDEEKAANFDRFEMPFPGVGPVLARQWFDSDFSRSKIQAAILKLPQSAAQVGAHGPNRPGQPLRVDGDTRRARRLVTINRSRLLEIALQKTGDGIFSLGRGGNRDLPHRAMKREERPSLRPAWPAFFSRRRSPANLLGWGFARRIERRPACQ